MRNNIETNLTIPEFVKLKIYPSAYGINITLPTTEEMAFIIKSKGENDALTKIVDFKSGNSSCVSVGVFSWKNKHYLQVETYYDYDYPLVDALKKDAYTTLARMKVLLRTIKINLLQQDIDFYKELYRI